MAGETTIQERWQAFVITVNAWLATKFWNAEDEDQTWDIDNITKMIGRGNRGDDDTKTQKMKEIRASARHNFPNNPLVSIRVKDTRALDIFNQIKNDAEKMLVLFTMRSGDIKSQADGEKIAIQRIGRALEKETEIDSFISSLTFKVDSDE